MGQEAPGLGFANPLPQGLLPLHEETFTDKIDQNLILSSAVPPNQMEAESHAQEAGLRYVRDLEPGYGRRRAGKGFCYLDEKGRRITDKKLIARIQALTIPPAWTEVWICRHDNGHLQCTGRDARGRKQYRYHDKWTVARNETKFGKLSAFAKNLPKIYDQTERDLRRQGLPKEKVLAAVVRVMDLTRIRVGNDVYAEENDSYGLTTLLNKHTDVKGTQVKFKFKGKSGIEHDVQFRDPRLSRIIKRCQELPGEELFAYEDDDGHPVDISSTDVNDYLREIAGENVTAKDFRTWGGSMKALELLSGLEPCKKQMPERLRKKRELQVIKQVAGYLRNTVAVCRKYYVHPAIFEADRKGLLHRMLKRRRLNDPSQLYNLALKIISV